MACNLTTNSSMLDDVLSPAKSVVSDVLESSLEYSLTRNEMEGEENVVPIDMDQVDIAIEATQDSSIELKDEQIVQDESTVSDVDTKQNELMDELRIATDQIPGGLSPQDLTPRGSETKSLTLPEEYLSPSSECLSARTEETDDDLQWSIRFQPDIDRLSIGDSYLRSSPVNASTPAVKPTADDLAKRGTGDLLSKLYGDENKDVKADNVQSEEGRRSTQFLGEGEVQSAKVAEPGDEGDQTLAKLPLETSLNTNENNLDVSRGTEGTDDYMPIEERIKLLGIDLDRPPEDTDDPVAETSGEIPFMHDQMDADEQHVRLGQESFDPERGDIRNISESRSPFRTRYAGDGGDNSTAGLPQSNSLNRSGLVDSSTASHLGVSNRSTEILFSTGELSITSLEVARILANAVQEDDGDWRTERSAAEGGVGGDIQSSGNHRVTLPSWTRASLQMQGPDLRLGVGQESLAERRGNMEVPFGVPDLPFSSDVGERHALRSSEGLDADVDRNMDGESREVVGGFMNRNGQEINETGNQDEQDINSALSDSLRFVSDDEDVQEDEGIIQDDVDGIPTDHSGIGSTEDRWVLERSISGSSGSDHQDSAVKSFNTSGTSGRSDHGGKDERHFEKADKNDYSADAPNEVPKSPVQAAIQHDENVQRQENRQTPLTVQELSKPETSEDSIPSLFPDKGTTAPVSIDTQSISSGPVTPKITEELGRDLTDDRAVSPASSSNTVDTLDIDVRQILHRYGKSLTDEDTEDERKSTESTTQSEKDKQLRQRVKKLLGPSYLNDSETNSDLPSDSEWINKLSTECSTDGDSDTERKVASCYEEKVQRVFAQEDKKQQNVSLPESETTKERNTPRHPPRPPQESLRSQSWTSFNDAKQRSERQSLEMRPGSAASSTRSSQSGSINYEYLQKELDEIQHGLAELQKYDVSKEQRSATAMSSSTSLKIGDSDRDSEIGTPRKYSWDYSADLGVNHSAEGRFMTHRRKYNEDQNDTLGLVEGRSSAESVTPTPSLQEQEMRASLGSSRSPQMPVRQLFSNENCGDRQLGLTESLGSQRSRDAVFHTGLLPSNMSAAQKVLARFAEEEKLRKQRFIDRDLNASAATRLVPHIDQDLPAADRVQQMMQRDSPAKQAYDFLDKADQERHLLEMRQYIHAQVREAASPVRSSLQSDLRQAHNLQEPLTAMGAMRHFLSSQLVKTARADLDHSLTSAVPGGPINQNQRLDQVQSPMHAEDIRDMATPVDDLENRFAKHGRVLGKSSMSTHLYVKKRREKFHSSDSDTDGDRTVVSRNSAAEDDIHTDPSTDPIPLPENPEDRQERNDQLDSAGVWPGTHLRTDHPNNADVRMFTTEDSRLLGNDMQQKLSRESSLETRLPHSHILSQTNNADVRKFTTEDSRLLLNDVQQSYRESSLETQMPQSHSLPPTNSNFRASLNSFSDTRIARVSRSEDDLRKPHHDPIHFSPNTAQMNTVNAWKSSQHSPRSLPESSRSPQDSSRSPLESSRSPFESSRSQPDTSRSPHDSYRSGHNSSRSSSLTPTNLRPYRPAGSNQVYYVESDMDDGSTSMTTMESTHFGSDDARGPEFHPSVYGTRQDPPLPSVGIYHRKKSPRSTSPPRANEPVKFLDPIQENVSFDERRSASEHSLLRSKENENLLRNSRPLQYDYGIVSNNANVNNQSKDQTGESNENRPPRPDKGTSYSLSDVQATCGDTGNSVVSDPAIFRTPRRAANTNPMGNLSRTGQSAESRLQRPESSDQFVSIQSGLDFGGGQRVSGSRSADVFVQAVTSRQSNEQEFQDALEDEGNFKPLEIDLENGNSLRSQRSSTHQKMVYGQEEPEHFYSSDELVTNRNSRTAENDGSLQYQKLGESYGLNEAKKTQAPWSPSPIALRHQELESQEGLSMSSEGHEAKLHDDTWESDLPANINDMWERFKRSSLFSDSETESRDVDLSRLQSLITNPVRHLVQELRNERRERRDLERQLLENLRNKEKSSKPSGRRSSSPGKSHRRESELSQHLDVDSSMTSVTYRSEVSDLLESDDTSDVTVSSSTPSSGSAMQKPSRQACEENLRSIPENVTIESTDVTTDVTTDSDTQTLHSDSSLMKLKYLIQQQKHQYLKDTKVNEKRLVKISKLEDLFADKSHRKSGKFQEMLIDDTTLSEGSLTSSDAVRSTDKKRPSHEVRHGKDKTSKAPGSPSRSDGRYAGFVTSSTQLSTRSDKSPHRSKGNSRRSDAQSPSSKGPKGRNRDASSGNQSRSGKDNRSKSPARRANGSPARSAPLKSPARTKKSKKQVEDDVPPMELRQVRYDQNEPRSPKHQPYSYMEFDNPRSSKKKTARKSKHDVTDSRQSVAITEIRVGNSKNNQRSVAVNVPTPISLSPATRRMINEVTMISEAVQTTPSLLNTKSQKKNRGPFTPEQTERSNISENDVPDQQPLRDAAGPGPAWFVNVEKEAPRRQPLRERQESVRSPSERSPFLGTEIGTSSWGGKPQSMGSSGYRSETMMSAFDINGLANAKDVLSLQEAFRLYRGDLIKTSRERQRLLYLKANERHMQEVSEQERALIFGLQPQFHEPNPFAHPYSDQLHRPKRRFLTKREIRELTLKKYKTLPEVAHKNSEQKQEEERRANRIRAQIFAKKVQNKLLHRYSAWT